MTEFRCLTGDCNKFGSLASDTYDADTSSPGDMSAAFQGSRAACEVAAENYKPENGCPLGQAIENGETVVRLARQGGQKDA